MQCRQCHGENPAEARFCLHCGTPQALHCGQCGRDLPAEARFCMACGQAVGAAPAKPAAASLTQITPPASRPPRSEPAPRVTASPLPATLGAGRYRVKSFLGEGARKRVYLAVLECL